jgi:hypothetical protein
MNPDTRVRHAAEEKHNDRMPRSFMNCTRVLGVVDVVTAALALESCLEACRAATNLHSRAASLASVVERGANRVARLLEQVAGGCQRGKQVMV